MEKRNYVKPLLNSEEFVPQTYVAACTKYIDEEGTSYLFKCNAASKYQFWDWVNLTGYSVFKEDGTEIGDFNKCGAEHASDTDDEYIPGYIQKNILGAPAGEKYKVLIWTEGGTNIHCTADLDKENWVTYSHS